ncbi:lycopene beta-cyclase CrtY [Aurantiacibacter poecillastricola]|uniref:lycopene beta-cyclase CrtY n=1 Tax=Aurantiacibacter poecillastricola TaxID=3064385 RepID=UPI00273F295A|nr:lycopene beta-cyclase CrtY [Aurantiacibacter sp. 219JJ12-13]MDP5263088.1 lycopene beta-cyclase CrtY [Aurantiacibacter sp. 219JJ12-13]
MSGRDCDIAIIGGGLSGGLIALALTRHRPELAIRLIEAGPEPGGNHRWSWFASDLSPRGSALMEGFHKAAWDEGYDIRFPAHERTLGTPYRSLASTDFAARLERDLPEGSILVNAPVAALDEAGVDLEDGRRITARCVIDCRGFAPTGHLEGGWQVFMGRHLRTPAPHGITRPTIMDASVEQHAPYGNSGAYRFVYVLPLGERDLFIEDTYYADKPDLDRSMLSARIDQYQRKNGWEGETVGLETGVLPVITGGDFAAYQSQCRIPGVATAGARGGFVHPLTSYTLPMAVDLALAIAADADLPGDRMAAKVEALARQHWKRMGHYRMLGTMLFCGARPRERYRVFERFYRLSERLIERFYTGRSTLLDKARVLTGKPPIPITRGIGALMSSAPPLQAPSRKDQT